MPGKDLRQSFDSSIADRSTSTKMNAEGLPGFLGCSFSEFSPGRLRAELKVRPELLTPFGNMHGGVMAALCDHALGCACYPHCCVSGHSGSRPLQLQHPESRGHFRGVAPSLKRLPIRSKWRLSTLDGPTTTASKRQSANPEIGNYFQN